ncbi:hypothetical protein ABB02_02055 [Clostridiaceae bacterium JG1575]|nr:hypothetical protein ABB02_02055 [Clostridiaceae bacterium JG1575]
MRMLVKYTAFIDFDQEGQEVDRSYYLSFVRGEDVMDIPFDSMEALKEKAAEHTLASLVTSDEFKKEVQSFDDYREFFQDIDVLVLYEASIPVQLNALLEE